LSRAIIQDIIGLDAYHRSHVVMAYVTFGSELQTGDFIRHALEAGKTLVLPRVNRVTRSLELYAVREPARDLEPGVWGILEPAPDRCAPVDPTAVDVILVPGLAFDARRRRLGYGGGFYDRLLGGLTARPPLVAGAFEAQMVEAVPAGARDVTMDIVVTEGGRYPTDGRDGPALTPNPRGLGCRLRGADSPTGSPGRGREEPPDTS
jgi:5-formyltetrahydrofolate cyclo-ligase